MIYVASPYSSPIPELVESRYRQVRQFTDKMIEAGFVAFSPIAYCHPIARRIGKETSAEVWHHFNMNMLRRAEALYGLCLPGWEESKGMTMELRVAKMLDIPAVLYGADFRLKDEAWVAVAPMSFA